MNSISEKYINPKDITRLTQYDDDDWKASILIPTIQSGAETQQNPIRFKNAIRSLEEKLESLDNNEDLLESVKKAAELIDDYEFWQHQYGGLAMFLSKDVSEYYRLGYEVQDFTYIRKRFYVKPLISHTFENKKFYILSLGKDKADLYLADSNNIQIIDLEDAPASLGDALGHELSEQQLQFHSQGSSGKPMYHAQGAGEDDVKAEIKKYYSLLDEHVVSEIQKLNAPLVLAGVEYLQPIYKEATKYEHLVDEGVTGSIETYTEDELQQKSWKLVESIVTKQITETVDEFGLKQSQNLASTDISDCLLAAMDGRVETLLLAKNEYCWGNVDYDKRNVELNDEDTENTQELLNFAACETHDKGGKVIVLEEGNVPGDNNIATIYRY